MIFILGTVLERVNLFHLNDKLYDIFLNKYIGY